MKITKTDTREEFDVYTASDGTELPRTSSVLDLLGDSDDDTLMNWAGRQALQHGAEGAWKDTRDFYGRVGTRGHELIECAIVGELIDKRRADPERLGMPDAPRPGNAVDIKALTVMNNWGRWLKSRAVPCGFEPISAELSIRSKKLGYGGTVDCLANMTFRDGSCGGLKLVDWKSSSGIRKPRYQMQLVAYAALVEEECVWIEGQSPLSQEDELTTCDARRVVTREHAQALGFQKMEPVEITGGIIVRCDREATKWEQYEVRLEEFGGYWDVFSRLVELHGHVIKLKQQERRR